MGYSPGYLATTHLLNTKQCLSPVGFYRLRWDVNSSIFDFHITDGIHVIPIKSVIEVTDKDLK